MQNLPKPVLIFLGPPGSGKGTQARMAAEKYGLIYLGCGDILRETVKGDTGNAKVMKEHMKKGKLLSDELVTKIFIEKFKETLKTGVGVAADGYPRDIGQAKELDKAIGEFENIFSKVIFIDLDEQTAEDRILKRRTCTRCKKTIPFSEETKVLKRCPDCGGELIVRADDTPETVKKRWSAYVEKTEPVIEYYKSGGGVIKVDGKPEIEEIFEQINTNLELIGTNHE